MNDFRQCIEDLATVERLLELPHGGEIAAELFRKLSPYLKELADLKACDPSGGIERILGYAGRLEARLNGVPTRVSTASSAVPRQGVA